jgi:hypothetical protein
MSVPASGTPLFVIPAYEIDSFANKNMVAWLLLFVRKYLQLTRMSQLIFAILLQKTIFAVRNMKTNRHIAKCLSVLFIIILMLKAGGGLYLHYWLHSQKSATASSGTTAISQNPLTCTCIDDFNIPFTETPGQVVQKPGSIKIEFVASLASLIPSFSKFFHSLRGPPLKA